MLLNILPTLFRQMHHCFFNHKKMCQVIKGHSAFAFTYSCTYYILRTSTSVLNRAGKLHENENEWETMCSSLTDV